MKGSALALALFAIPGAAQAARPVLIELFTAQGCATCDKADAAAAKWIDRQGVVVLTWSVDYWDYLGWKDAFAQPAFTARQRRYDTRFGLRDVYTPQIVVNGAAQGSGDKPGAIESLVRQARRQKALSPEIEARSGRVAVGSGRRPAGGGEVWLVRYDPAEKTVEVKAGDNKGATVTERNVVRQLARLGPWSGRPVSFRAPAPTEDGLKTLVMVQGVKGGPIIAASEMDPD